MRLCREYVWEQIYASFVWNFSKWRWISMFDFFFSSFTRPHGHLVFLKYKVFSMCCQHRKEDTKNMIICKNRVNGTWPPFWRTSGGLPCWTWQLNCISSPKTFQLWSAKSQTARQSRSKPYGQRYHLQKNLVRDLHFKSHAIVRPTNIES